MRREPLSRRHCINVFLLTDRKNTFVAILEFMRGQNGGIEMIKGVAHICVAATDLPAVERFYCKGLGLTKAFDFIRNDKVIGFYLEMCRGQFMEVFLQDTIDLKATGPIQHFCLEVDDLDKIGAKLTENGYKVTPKTLGPDQSWQMWTTDPSGVRIEFHQYTERSFQITRENCVFK